MDELDFFLLKTLAGNSRLTYRELADICELSVSATHKRINKLIEDGIIEAFIARPSTIALKCLRIMIFGTSTANVMELISKELGQHKNINFVGFAGQKSLSISAFLRDISELQDLIVYVSNTAHISDPLVGIVNLPYKTLPEPLTSIDFKILKFLNRDARKPITDIALDVGISSKTVKKRLDRMIENDLVTFSIQWKPLCDFCFITVFSIILKKSMNMKSVIDLINQKYSENIVYCLNYSNIPNMITLEVWTRTAQESQKIQRKLQTEGFKDITPYVALWGEYFDCWIDQLVRTK